MNIEIAVSKNRVIQIICLIFAGEIIFGLPFHTARFFRPTFLDVFNFSNTYLGDIFAVYGLTAMLSYFAGGMIADRISARALMSISLILTACGGLYMSTIPGEIGMMILYGYWGITTIFLFWAAMIKATKDWGGDLSQGKAFGLLDGGRGLVAIVVSVVAIAILANYLPSNTNQATDMERLNGFRSVILLYSVATGVTGILIWLLIPSSIGKATKSSEKNIFSGLTKVLNNRLVWSQAGIIICAYSTYKGLDNFSLYAFQVLGMNEVEAAQLFTYGSLTRPIAAVFAGILADRFLGSRVILIMFAILIASFGFLAIGTTTAGLIGIIYTNIFVSFFAVFALRGIYFALLQETKTQREITGTTVGIVSFMGFTPEIFFGPISGRILDAAPGIQGHHNYFLFLTGISVVGLCVAMLLIKLNKLSSTRKTVLINQNKVE